MPGRRARRDRRGGALERRGRPRAPRPRPSTDGVLRLGHLPGRARAGVVGAALPRRPARCCCRPRPATSSSTGAATTTSAAARTARLHAQRLARHAAVVRHGAGSADVKPQWSLRDVVPMVREHFGVAGVSARAPRRSSLLAVLAPAAAAQRPPSPARYDASARRAGAPRRATSCARSPRGRGGAPGARRHDLTYGRVYYKSKAKRRWQVSFFARPSGRGAARRSSRRPSSTTAAAACSRAGPASRSRGRWRAATRARSGGTANALWIWLPLCALFVLPFARPPLRLLHLDLRCCSRSRSPTRLQRRADRRVGPAGLSAAAVPARADAADRARGARPRRSGCARAGDAWLGIAAVFLLGFRCGLNVSDRT